MFGLKTASYWQERHLRALDRRADVANERIDILVERVDELMRRVTMLEPGLHDDRSWVPPEHRYDR